MTPSPLDIARRAYDAYATGDVATVFALLDPGIEIVQTSQLPWGGTHRGLEEAKLFFGTLAAHTTAKPEPERFIVAGDEVAVVGRLRGVARETGSAIDIDIVHVLTVRDGRIARFAAYIDTPAMLAALGRAP